MDESYVPEPSRHRTFGHSQVKGRITRKRKFNPLKFHYNLNSRKKKENHDIESIYSTSSYRTEAPSTYNRRKKEENDYSNSGKKNVLMNDFDSLEASRRGTRRIPSGILMKGAKLVYRNKFNRQTHVSPNPYGFKMGGFNLSKVWEEKKKKFKSAKKKPQRIEVAHNIRLVNEDNKNRGKYKHLLETSSIRESNQKFSPKGESKGQRKFEGFTLIGDSNG